MLTIILRTFIMYGAILMCVRLMGKRQISQLQTSELVVTLLISELAVMPIHQYEESVWHGIIPMAALVLCEVFVSLGMLKSGKFRQLVCGKPVIIIEHGKILQHEMRKLRLSTEDLFEQLRENGVFFLKDVAYAIVETDGALSVLKKTEVDSLTPKQAGIKTEPEALEVVIVSDGKLSQHSIMLCGKDSEWVRRMIRKEKLELAEVFLMTCDKQGRYRILKKEKSVSQ